MSPVGWSASRSISPCITCVHIIFLLLIYTELALSTPKYFNAKHNNASGHQIQRDGFNCFFWVLNAATMITSGRGIYNQYLSCFEAGDRW